MISEIEVTAFGLRIRDQCLIAIVDHHKGLELKIIVCVESFRFNL